MQPRCCTGGLPVNCFCILHFCASSLTTTIWRMLVDVSIAARLPTKRCCRGGAQKQRTINPVIGHQPLTNWPHTHNNNNLIQIPTVAWDLAVIMDKSKFGLINAISLRNKSLFVCNFVDKCSLDIVALTDIWLTDDDKTSVSELCRDTFTLVHQPHGAT